MAQQIIQDINYSETKMQLLLDSNHPGIILHSFNSAFKLLENIQVQIRIAAGKFMNIYKIAVVPGDGIGKEIVQEGARVLDSVAVLENF